MHADGELHLLVDVLFVDHLGVVVEVADQLVVRDVRAHLARLVVAGDVVGDALLQHGEVQAACGGDEDRVGIFAAKAGQNRRVVERVDLVEHLDDVVVLHADLLERLAHHLHLLLECRMTYVNDVQ